MRRPYWASEERLEASVQSNDAGVSATISRPGWRACVPAGFSV